jgi:hypothetical protein
MSNQINKINQSINHSTAQVMMSNQINQSIEEASA